MPTSHLTPPTTFTPVLDLKELGIHHDFIKNVASDTLGLLPERLIKRLNEHSFNVPTWYTVAPLSQRMALNATQALNHQSLQALHSTLDQISTVEGFAVPLLEQALLKAFGTVCDVNKNVISLTTLNSFTDEIERTDTHTLLQAALHNFEGNQARANGIPWGSHLWDYKSTHSSDPAPHSIPIEPTAFAKLCRDLDIGGRYQQHLQRIFNPPGSVEKNLLEQRFIEHERNTLMLHADIALMKKDILATTHRTLIDYCKGHDSVQFNGNPLTVGSMSLDDIAFHSFIVFHAPSLEQDSRCVIYIPGDPVSGLKEYPNLRSAHSDLMSKMGIESYRQFFVHLASQSQKLKLSKRLTARFQHSTRDPLYMQHQPILLNLFRHLYQKKTGQLFNDARFLAVPTAEKNRLTLIDRFEHYLDVTLNILNVEALFVPGLGEVMMVVFAAQMMTEVYHGIEAWEQDEKEHAWSYTKDVLMNLAFVAVAGKVASEITRPAAVRVSPFVEELDVIELPGGKTQLWKPDLTPFEHDIDPGASEGPDNQGLYTHEGKSYLALEGKNYRVQKTAEGTWRLQHPTDPEHYAPPIDPNGHGAWIHEAEELSQWSESTLVRRLDPSLSDLSDEQARYLMHASQTDSALLRQAYRDLAPPPALLEDGITRFKLKQHLEQFIQKMRTHDTTADPLLQLQVLVDVDLWPRSKALRCLDSEGKTIIEYGNGSPAKVPVIQILDSQIRRGELLKSVLLSLDDNEVRALTGNGLAASIEEKVQRLSTKIADRAEQLSDDLFRSLYARSNRSTDPLVMKLITTWPGLPVPVATELVDAATSAERWALEDGVRIPLPVAEEARLYVEEVRLAHACDDFYFDYDNNPDTQKLILHSLEKMPGWSPEVRLEVRDKTLSGALLDEVGPRDAPLRKVLVKVGSRYLTYNASEHMLHGLDDIYASVLHALPDQERAALGFPHTGQGQALKEALVERPGLDRQALSKVLGFKPTTLKTESPLQLAKGRIRYPAIDPEAIRCGRAPFPCFRASPRRVRHLKSKMFPMHTNEVVERFLELESLYSRAGLARLEALNKEYKALKESLSEWINGPLEMVQVNESHLRPVHISDKTRAANKIIRCWQRSSGMGTEFPGARLNITNLNLARLPALNADFSHVTSLQMSDMYLHESIDPFLAQFPNLQELKFESAHLEALPASLFNLQELKQLHLSKNRITLTPEAAEKLAALKKLRVLNLSSNPLDHLPDFTQMSELARLDLRATGLTQWPEGIEHLPFLTHLDLRANSLTALPQGYFQIPVQRLRNTFLHDNPFDNSTWDAINAHRTRQGLALERRVHAPVPTHHVNLWLDPSLTESERVLKTAIWTALEAEPNAENFFRVIRDLVVSADFQHDRQQLTEKVWKVLECAAEDAGYREEVFASSLENETCVDRTSTIFGRFGFKFLLREALLAEGSDKETRLLALMKGRVRLLELDDIAQTQVALQHHAYRSAVSEHVLSPEQISRLEPDELEVKLIYQVDLAQRLELPWQPSHMQFRAIAKISPAQIEEAYHIVLNKETVHGYMAKKLLEEGIWRDHIQSAYSADIKAGNLVFEQRYVDLETLQEKQQRWVDTVGSDDTDARLLLQQELQQLAQRLNIDQTRVFTGAPMPEADYYAELENIDRHKKKTLERITQNILDTKTR